MNKCHFTNSFKLLIAAALSVTSFVAQAQTGSDFLTAYKKADTTVPFDVKSAGRSLPVNWGMDTAWDDIYNVKWGIAHYGTNFTTGRISFQPYGLVNASNIDNASANFGLPDAMAKKLQTRIDHIKWTGTTNVEINCDHEALYKVMNDDGTLGAEQTGSNRTGYNNYVTTNNATNTTRWVNLIKATVKYAQNQGLTVVSVAPFNESDYGWSQYRGNESNGMERFLEIAQALKNDTFFKSGAGKDIRICGGNTLNCDRALPWYNYLKNSIDEGNTHQLAGSFDTYASFFSTVRADGKVATADELHNVGEAIVGANYGMQNGIWWAFNAKARGQFMMDSNEGVQIGYGENRGKWTSAAVYRNDKDSEVHGFIGTSERQAETTNYQFVSKTKDVYFNGFGPTRQWAFEIPGGTGYQVGQTNAELVFDITYGDDVAPFYPNGNYQIMSASDLKLLTTNGYWNGGNHIYCKAQSNSNTQHWHIYPDNVKTSGDCSYWFIDNLAEANQHLNLLNGGNYNNLSAGARIIAYNAGHDALEQWYIRYAKDGYFYIMARQSNKYIYNNNGVITLEDAPTSATSASELLKYKWRLMPTDATAETTAPAVPTGLNAIPQSGSIKLGWTAIAEAKATYTVLRKEGDEWNTIGRGISGNSFIDNTAIAGRTYQYKVQAVDYSGNRSNASSSVSSSISSSNAMLMKLSFDDNTNDETENALNASLVSTPRFDSKALVLDDDNYAMIPYSVVCQNEMTIAMWVNCNNEASWQRVFDFGNDTDHYMFFTPTNGSKMRFVMKNGGAEQVLEGTSALGTKTWKHVAITIANNKVTLYVDGVENASTTSMTIKPSDIEPILCYIGRSMYNADPLFEGSIDDMRIYNYALNASEIASLKQENEEELKEPVGNEEVGTWKWTGETLAAGDYYIMNAEYKNFVGNNNSNLALVSEASSADLFTVSVSRNNYTFYNKSVSKYLYHNGSGTVSYNNSTNWTIATGASTGGYTLTNNNRYFRAHDVNGLSAPRTSSQTKDNSVTWFFYSKNQMDKYNEYLEYVDAFEEVKSYAQEYTFPNDLTEKIREALSDKPAEITYTTNIDDYLTELREVADECFDYVNREYGVSDMTNRIVNPGFESTVWNEGWTTVGFVEHENAGQFGGAHIAEMYLANGDGVTPNSGKVEQVIHSLPAGDYVLSATATGGVGSDYLYVKIGDKVYKTDVPNTQDVAKNYEVTFRLSQPSDVTIGFARENSVWWSAVDDFRLTYSALPYVKKGTFNGQYIFTNHNDECVVFGRGANWGTQAIPTTTDGIKLNINVSNYIAQIKYTDTNKYLFDAGNYNIYTDNTDGNASTNFYLLNVGNGYKIVLVADEYYSIGIGTDGEYTTLKLVPTADAPIWYFGSLLHDANLTVRPHVFGTFVAPFVVTLPQGVTAYNVDEIKPKEVTLSHYLDGGSELPAYTPVIVKNNTDEKIVVDYKGYCTSENTLHKNHLIGYLKAGEELPTGSYVLQDQNDGKGQMLYEVRSKITSSKNRCCLDVIPVSQAALRITVVDEDFTVIEQVDETNSSAEYYSISGVKLSAPQSGINLIKKDGKVMKIFVK